MGQRDTDALKPRKEPAQRRSALLVEAVLEAATRILREGGEVTTAGLCERAGVSPGSLYQYFPNKEAVYYALLRRHAEEVTTRMTAVLAAGRAAPVEVLVADAVEAFVDAHRTDPEVHAVLGAWVAREAGPGLEEDLLDGAQALLAHILEARRSELSGHDPAVLAFLLVRGLEGPVHAAARDQPALLGDPAFVAGLERMMLGLLTPVANRPSGSG